ncbi:MAG: radical SAM protein [bacterium]|nr:radical SAM protein [bacterium]
MERNIPQNNLGDSQNILVDRFGRVHDYLRISVTDRCNLRCTYCMPAAGLQWKTNEQLLSSDEIVQVARVMAGLGVKKIRLTGGEPTTRHDLADLVVRLATIDGINSVSLTTNGVLFARSALSLKQAGAEWSEYQSGQSESGDIQEDRAQRRTETSARIYRGCDSDRIRAGQDQHGGHGRRERA